VEGAILKKRPSNKAFFKIHHNVIDSNKFRKMPASAQCLYFHLTRLQNWYCNGKPGTFEQRDWQLILETGLPERTIQRDKKTLKELGLIKTNRQGTKGPTVYTILTPMEGKDDE
jgi:replication initiation and membrane attachment protein DnaB